MGSSRNYGLRLALAVTLGLTLEIEREALLPPLSPVIALQLLALPGPPPPARLIVGLLILVAVTTTLAYAIATLTTWNPALYTLGVGLIYLWGFALAVRPKTAPLGTLLLTMGIVVTALAAASTGLAAFVILELMMSVVVGLGLVFLAHAVFPHRAPSGARPAPGAPTGSPLPAAAHALLATVIILPLHLLLTADGIAALVVLLTVATMLRQPGLAQSAQFGFTFAAGNLLGGILAALAVAMVALHEAAAVLATVVAAGALIMASWLVSRPERARVLLPGFIAFTLLIGLAFSPLAPDSEVAYLQRVAQITTAALYALGGLSILLPAALWMLRPKRTAGT